MKLRNSLLALLFACGAASAGTVTFTLSGTEPAYSGSQSTLNISQSFPIFMAYDDHNVLLNATYTQTPHTCSGVNVCNQDLHTLVATSPGVYFEADPASNTCGSIFGGPFPCSVYLPAGKRNIDLSINDVLFGSAFIGAVMNGFTDTMTVTLSSAALVSPEPSSYALQLIGLACAPFLAYFRSRR
jgi:hypothetical protein